MIHDYYKMVTPLYREGWGDSFNFPPFAAGQSLDEATAAQERHIADDGGFRPGWRVLDVGCGVGGPALTIAAHSGAEITGVNISPNQLPIARQITARRGLSGLVRFIGGDAMRLPFQPESFEGAYVIQSMCHAPDKPRAYREIARVVKPAGVFLGNDWLCRDNITRAEYADYIEPICRTWALPSLISPSELAGQLEQAGFVVKALGDVAERGDMTPNWEMFETKSQSLAARRPQSPGVRLMREAIAAVVRAARAGVFLVGYWHAVKALPRRRP
ncbi:MAG TPA: methyltransferase domain-containing protein [Streptosporangiaceae bacterium]|nr:methyltransferase domain-containing protein [Streptosporangiaceae bacterium]